MFFGRCPSRDALEMFAVRPDSPRVAKHIVQCAQCRQTVQALCQDEELLAELRMVTQEGDENAAREHIVAICVRAAQEVEQADAGGGDDPPAKHSE